MKFYRHIPNAFTLLNAAFGFLAIAELFGDQNPGKLSLYFALGLLCDVFDGAVARLLKVSSPLGTQLDSLADVISFGLFPSALLYQIFFPVWGTAALALSCICLAACVYRLAQFNLRTSHIPGFFEGLPTPAFAALCYLLYIIHIGNVDNFAGEWYALLLAFYLAFLLNSRIKFLNFKPNVFSVKTLVPRIAFLLCFILILLYPTVISLVIILLLYHILSAIAYRIEL